MNFHIAMPLPPIFTSLHSEPSCLLRMLTATAYSNSAAIPAMAAPAPTLTTAPAPVDGRPVSPPEPPVPVWPAPVCVGWPVTTTTVPFAPVVPLPPMTPPVPWLGLAVPVMVTVPMVVELPVVSQRMAASWTGLVAMSAGVLKVNFAEPGTLPSASWKAAQVRRETSTPSAETILRPQTAERSGWMSV